MLKQHPFRVHPPALCIRPVGCTFAVFFNLELTMQSLLEILVINVKAGTSKKSGAAYSIPEAQCVLRNDDGTVAGVGVLVIPKALEEHAKPGIFTGSFALEAASYGPDQGRIVARLTGLVPVPPNAIKRSTPAAS